MSFNVEDVQAILTYLLLIGVGVSAAILGENVWVGVFAFCLATIAVRIAALVS